MMKTPFPRIKNNISKELFLNYFVLFIIISISLYGTYLYVQTRVDTLYNEKEYVQLETIFNDYLEGGLEYAVVNTPAKIEFIEYINEDLIVTDSYNSSKEIGYQYTGKELDDIMSDYYEVLIYYPYDFRDDFLLIFAPDFFAPPDVSALTVKAILGYTLFLMLLLFFYSKWTSRRIIEPIQHLNNAVDQIAEGNYQPYIPYDSENELGHLKEAIVNMGETIRSGIAYRAQAEQSRKQLIMNISHDLKTPLTNIRGYAETISEAEEMHPESFRTYIDIIKSNSIRADLLINDLFELTTIESGVMELNMTVFDLCEDLRRMLILHVPQLEDQKINYNFDIPNEKVWIKADKLRLDRAIGNLIINSIRYCGEGTALNISIHPLIKRVELIIEDTGPGMPAGMSDTIFDPFVRTDQARGLATGGSGLGLAITRSIVNKHGGSIELDHGYTNGCRFIINLPTTQV